MNLVTYRARIWIAQRRKALVALCVSAVGAAAVKNGWGPLSDEQTVALTALLTSLATYLAPNKEEG